MAPINVDIAVGPKHFAGFRESQSLLVTSFFRTLQGEAPFAGYPAVFLRLAGCNYGAKDNFCQFCDTAFQFALGKRMSFEAVSQELAKLRQPGDILVITGGEPSLQTALLDWIPQERGNWRDVQMETNGTQFKFFLEAEKLDVHFPVVVSPKASFSTKKYPQIHPAVLANATCLKFVLEPDPESPHYELPNWALQQDIVDPFIDDTVPVYVSPAAYYLRAPASETASAWDHTLIDAEKTARSYAYAAEYAMKHGVRLSIQTHLFAAVP